MAITFILRIKITGYEDNDDLVDFLKNSLRLRINEVEKTVESMKAKCVMVHSSEGTSTPDMAQYTIRITEEAMVDDNYEKYPFDTITATLRIELSHFTLNDEENYRFDVYRTQNEVSFKPDADGLALFGVNYEECS